MTGIALLAAAVTVPHLFEGGNAAGYQKVAAPGVRYRMNMATATTAPWIDSNLWRYRRQAQALYLVSAAGKSVALAMAEAAALRVQAGMEIAPDQKAVFDRMAAWMRELPPGPVEPWTNFNVSDDGSAAAQEVQRLMSRRNLLYRITPAHQARFRLTSSIQKPYEYVLDARDAFGDERRLLRLFGSELTLAELAREGKRVRLHLLNYGNRPVETLRIRLKGRYNVSHVQAYVFDDPAPRLTEFFHEDRFTEFTLSRLPVYAVLDLTDSGD